MRATGPPPSPKEGPAGFPHQVNFRTGLICCCCCCVEQDEEEAAVEDDFTRNERVRLKDLLERLKQCLAETARML